MRLISRCKCVVDMHESRSDHMAKPSTRWAKPSQVVQRFHPPRADVQAFPHLRLRLDSELVDSICVGTPRNETKPPGAHLARPPKRAQHCWIPPNKHWTMYASMIRHQPTRLSERLCQQGSPCTTTLQCRSTRKPSHSPQTS